ncbi:NUDIX hydrolase [Rhizobium sp. RCAM05350]|nr:NUDIX hydrolase [Rhizobium sp. RCAM05350]
MPRRKMIRIDATPRRFNFRIVGLGFRNGHVLVHRAVHEDFWSFPGGRAEIGETSVETLKREMVEELGVDVTVGRMLWTVENFFRYEAHDYHEIGFYYLMEIPESFPFHASEIVHRLKDGDSDLEFKWVKATKGALTALDVPPYFIAGQIENLPQTPVHIIWDDDDPAR